MAERGKVFFVGCGPGDPELITKKGYDVLKNSDIVIYTGSLINPQILEIPKNAEKIDSFGKSVDEIVDIMERYVNQGKSVVRLHDGDPSIFGSIKEQFELLEERGINYEVIPGVSSFLAMASRLKLELTIPEVTQTVVITRYPGKTPVPENIKKIAEEKPTMIFFLSASLLRKIVDDLIDVGYPPDFPCALCYKVSWEDEKIIRGTLSDIVDKARREGIKMHALFLVSKALTAKGKRSFIYSERYAQMQKKKQNPKNRKTENKTKTKKEDKEIRKEVLKKFIKKIAFFSITKGGAKIVLELARKMEVGDEKTVFIPQKFYDMVLSEEEKLDGREKGRNGEEKEKEKGQKLEVRSFRNAKETLREAFTQYDSIIAVMSLGALVRIISPELQSKEKDPAVLCIDEVGRYVISVLSGHVGGANELARYTADVLGATPVITTASDSLGTIPVDIFGREWGWYQEADHDTFVKVSSAMVNSEPVVLVQESGEREYKIPKNVKVLSTDEFFERQKEFSACLFITHRIIGKGKKEGESEKEERIEIPTVFYRPKVLHVGIGFDSGVDKDDLVSFLLDTFEKNSLSPYSIKKVVTLDKKKEDGEFMEFIKFMAEKFGAEHGFVSKDELEKVKHLVRNPSRFAEKYLGIPSVSEASALLSAGQNAKLIVEKTKGRGKKGAGMTIAVAISHT